ncbi:hypothetical protein ACFBZI_11755 [Moraxella sp. ZJ142]|uniref:hypothetical protein n=1 Tax=Moraxella marmotae TaxID=3344520 RepID=UPI0035D4DAB1
MANWIDVQVTVTAPKTNIKNFIASLGDKQENGHKFFNLSDIIPMPSDIQATEGMEFPTAIHAILSSKDDNRPVEMLGLSAKRLQELKKAGISGYTTTHQAKQRLQNSNDETIKYFVDLFNKYGAVHIEDWGFEHWGTLVDVPIYYQENELDNGEISVALGADTAYTPPTALLLHLANKFGLAMNGCAVDDGADYGVRIETVDGEVCFTYYDCLSQWNELKKLLVEYDIYENYFED